MTNISHIFRDNGGNWHIQNNDAHLEQVAKLSERFATKFGMGNWGKALGLLHDKGKNKGFYSLTVPTGGGKTNVLAIGYRIRTIRGVQFRQWATSHLSEYLVKGFTMDDERQKNPDGRPDYFDELLQRIRDIRSSEKRFYQKLRDFFRLSSNYETKEKATQMFFAETQNKLLYAVTHNTAAEIVSSRADASKPNMGLTSWNGSIVRKADIVVAKNCLIEDEIDKLNRLVMLFLESAELRVKDRKCLTQ